MSSLFSLCFVNPLVVVTISAFSNSNDFLSLFITNGQHRLLRTHVRGDAWIITIILLKLWNYNCIHLYLPTLYHNAHLVNTVKYASFTKSQIKRKVRFWYRHMPSAYKKQNKNNNKKMLSDSNPFAFISQLRGWKGDTSLCLQSYKIKCFKMAAFVNSQYYPPLALCKKYIYTMVVCSVQCL